MRRGSFGFLFLVLGFVLVLGNAVGSGGDSCLNFSSVFSSGDDDSDLIWLWEQELIDF